MTKFAGCGIIILINSTISFSNRKRVSMDGTLSRDLAFYSYLHAEFRAEQIRQLQLARAAAMRVHDNINNIRDYIGADRVQIYTLIDGEGNAKIYLHKHAR